MMLDMWVPFFFEGSDIDYSWLAVDMFFWFYVEIHKQNIDIFTNSI